MFLDATTLLIQQTSSEAVQLNPHEIAVNLKQFLLVLAVSLGVATLPQIISWLHRIPYTLLLVIVGLGLAFVDIRLVELSPGLILSIFLPPLLFEAAWNLQWSDLKRDFFPICLYAIGGVVITVAGVAIGLNQFANVALPIALLIGACLSATDPVSVTALFRELGADKRLRTVMEGESLFNDGMAVVAFSALSAMAYGASELTPQSILLEFVQVVGIGIGIGSTIGFGISYITQRFDLPLVEQSLTLVSAYGVYLLAEDLGGSGVIAVVATGLILGNFGSQIGMSPRTRVIVTAFWEFLSFFVNSIVFLLIGDQIHFTSLGKNLGIIAVTVGMMFLTRAIAIYGLGWFSNRLTKIRIPIKEQTVLWWGGVRGSVSIALALSVSRSLGDRDAIIAAVFGAVLFTLLVQGLSIQPLMMALKLLGSQPLRQQYVEAIARHMALSRVLQHLDEVELRPNIEPEIYRDSKAVIQEELQLLQTEISRFEVENPAIRDWITQQLHSELIAIEADTYADLVRTGLLNQELSSFLYKRFQDENKFPE